MSMFVLPETCFSVCALCSLGCESLDHALGAALGFLAGVLLAVETPTGILLDLLAMPLVVVALLDGVAVAVFLQPVERDIVSPHIAAEILIPRFHYALGILPRVGNLFLVAG